jgi:outer membrane protein TolC
MSNSRPKTFNDQIAYETLHFLKHSIMKYIGCILLVLIIFIGDTIAQRIPQVPDSVRKKYQDMRYEAANANKVDISSLNQDSLIRERLVKLAEQNPAISIADANIRIADADVARAKMSWLSALNIGANINEFVIQGSEAASFFPKYNLGLVIPFDIVSRNKRDKKVASENLLINNEIKRDKQQILRTAVLVGYENYKEKNEIVLIQKSYIEYEYSAYEAAQKSYTDGEISLEDMNKTHQAYLTEKAKLVTHQKELNISIIQLEQLIGVPIAVALKVK